MKIIIPFDNLSKEEQVKLLFEINNFAFKELPENKILYIYLDLKK